MSIPFVPRDYQQHMINHIWRLKRCALWCFMGAGKTVSVLTAVDARSFTDDVYPVLVLAPLRVATSTWPQEVEKWDHLKHLTVSAITGNEQARHMAARKPAQIYTMNYENIAWLTNYWGDRWPYKTLILDESTKVKSFRIRQGGKRAQALGKVAHRYCTWMIELTGTCAPNGLLDLWGQMWFVDIGERLGRTFSAFKERWFRASPDGYGSVPMQHAQAQIQDKLRDVCLTIKAEDYFDLRAPVVTNVFVDLPMQARKHYAELEKNLLTELTASTVEVFGAAEKTMKLLQLASGALYTEKDTWEILHDEKLDALESIVAEFGGEPILVAYHFKSDLARLKKAFPQGRHLDKNPQTIEDWNAGKIPILFAHPQSAGHGLNLQYGGRVLVYFSHWWALEDRLQIAERLGPVRQLQAGFDRTVFVYNIMARDTVDEDVVARNDEKKSVQDTLLDAMRRRIQ